MRHAAPVAYSAHDPGKNPFVTIDVFALLRMSDLPILINGCGHYL